MRHPFCLLFALLCLILTARADAPPEPGAHRVYIGSGQMLTVTAARQLTLDVHVSQILYQPGSQKVAYTTMQIDGSTVTSCVKLTNLLTGQTTTLLQRTNPITLDTIRKAYYLGAWSGDGRYLLVGHIEPTTSTDNGPQTGGPVWYSVDVSVLPPKVHQVPLPTDKEESAGAMVPSPSRKLFLLCDKNKLSPHGTQSTSVFLYDPSSNAVRCLSLPNGGLMQGWADDTHLLIWPAPDKRFLNSVMDINTGKETSVQAKPTDQRLPPSRDDLFLPPADVSLLPPNASPFLPPTDVPPVPRRFPEISLSLSTVSLSVHGPNPQSHAHDASLWLNITGPKPRLPSVRLALIAAPGTPRIVFAPDQSSVLWVQHGDLYASRVGLRTATTREKYDAGETLTCDEERAIATSNARQIGLDILQYAQDYDEEYPSATNFRDGLKPYIKDTGLLTVRQYPFHYAAPHDLHVQSIVKPDATVMGAFTLPCAVVTVYADCHVRSLPPVRGMQPRHK